MNTSYPCQQSIHILEGPGNKSQKSLWHLLRLLRLCTSLIFTKCSKRSPMVSTWPNIMVAEVVIFNLCASCMISSHSCAPHFPLLINRRTRSINISAPPRAMNPSLLPSMLQYFSVGTFFQFGDMRYFRRTECMQFDRGIFLFYLPESIYIKIQSKIRVMAAL